ncbi:MAG: site-specific integrase [Methyloprofundus sp.]|nr:site-specific integrase [Methyloprofundus sp.]
MKTIQAKISDALIKRHQVGDIRQISCTRYPVKFRYRSNRARGSWHLVTYRNGQTRWRKLADWPVLTAAKLVSVMPDIMADLSAHPDADKVNVERFNTVGDLLGWYLARTISDRNISENRKNSVRSVISKHLTPRIASLELNQVTSEVIDEKLLWPLQAEFSVSYTRQIFDVLRIAFNRARKLKMLDFNPMAEIKFNDSIKAQIKHKDGRLIPAGIWKVAEQIESQPHFIQMLVTMMIAHGTRIGETRKARWDRFDFERLMWHIPAADTKTRVPHTVPITKRVQYMLSRYRQYQKSIGYTGVHLFPAKGKPTPIGEKRAGEHIAKVSGGLWTAHDLRKVARTIWATSGVDSDVAEMLLNHKLDKVKKPYINTRMEELKRHALEKYHEEIMSEGFKLLRMR